MNFEVYGSIIAAQIQPITERVEHHLAMMPSGDGQLSVTTVERHHKTALGRNSLKPKMSTLQTMKEHHLRSIGL